MNSVNIRQSRACLRCTGLVNKIIFFVIVCLQCFGESHSPFPLDISVGPVPQAFVADGKTRLVYELHLTNFSASRMQLQGLQVEGDGTSNVLADYRGEVLERMLLHVGESEAQAPTLPPVIPGGGTVVVFIDLTLPMGTATPSELRHRVSVSLPQRSDGSGKVESIISAPIVGVSCEGVPLLRQPMRGSGWVAVNSLFNPEHRRSFVPVDGKEQLAQRFAIDWVRIGPDSRLFHDDSKSNSNFYGYGTEVLAVANGLVSDIKDGLQDNAGSNDPSTRNVTLDNITGNYIILDLGQGRFALYAHLIPGSIRVRTGDRVKAGQVLAQLGNSGNSDAPHLHFHLMNGNSPLGAEGIPYEIDSFILEGVIDNGFDAVEKGEPWHPTKNNPVIHRREFPIDNAVVTFPRM